MPKTRSSPRRAIAFSTIVILLLALGGYLVYRHIQPPPNGCEVASGGRIVRLDVEQASVAATIAGVAQARGLPAHAVTIAYATAWQESHLRDLRSGTLDSVGVFQQRPSQGWGSPSQLADPVYAAGKFFAALVKVPGYLRLPVYQAAQDVQHSADGEAYQNYEPLAATMSGPFTGGTPHGVWCWYQRASAKSPQMTPMRRELLRTFGRLDVRDGAVAWTVRTGPSAAGWAVATWLVTHARAYGLSDVRYAGYQWSLTADGSGWTRDPSAPDGRVELR